MPTFSTLAIPGLAFEPVSAGGSSTPADPPAALAPAPPASMFGPASTAFLLLAPLAARAQVTATGPNGATNPSAPGLGAHNQTSDSRLVTLNGVDDFCLFAPAEPDSAIGNVEAEVVAWCTKERNGARLIPDGYVRSNSEGNS